MKQFKNYLSALVVFALIFTSCSKEESSALDDADANYVELTFSAALNDLANRAANKSQHFDDVPTCSDAEPDYARINFSYGGNNYEIVVDILSDSEGYFTAYSEDLKIPVNGGSTTVTLTGFLVYDSSHTIIWAAPVGSGLANYVNQVLPQSFNVAAGTKPYIDVEVLCFDRRMVNEYGYVFFDIIPEVIYPLCVFINYCNEEGRHWVANYSIDLYYGTNANGIQLYDSEDAAAQASVGTRNNGEFYADPLCLVVPGPPANLPNNQPYLYMIIYPGDWNANYGDIDNSPISVQLSWNDVNALLNNDGTTNEYLHLLIGECDGALQGDGTIPPPDCDLQDPNADCNNNGIPNRCDPTNPYWGTFDCDGDGFINSEDACPYVAGVEGGEGGDGCPAEGTSEDCENLAPACALNTEGALGQFCSETAPVGTNNGWIKIESAGELDLFGGLLGDEDFGNVTWTVTNGDLTVTIEGELENDTVTAYAIEVRPSYSNGTMNATCWESRCANLGSDGVDDVTHVFEGYDYSYPFYLNVTAVVCGVPATEG